MVSHPRDTSQCSWSCNWAVTGATGGGGGPGGGGGGSFIHYDALDASKDVGHEGHGCAEVVYVAPSAQTLRTQIFETSKLKRSVSAPKRAFISW